jgi:glycosyltransferase involved in cell wall biosynthesis
MRLLFVAPSAYLLGGVQDWLYTLTLELRNKGHEVKVAVPNNHFHNGTLFNEYYKGIEAVYFGNRTGSIQGRMNALSKLLISCTADIIVGVNIGDLYEAYKKISSKMQKPKIVMTLHALEIEYLRDIGRYSRFLDGIITTNRLSRRIVTELDLLSNTRVWYAPYGVYPNRSIGERKQDDKLKIAWVGRLEDQQKRVTDLICIVRFLEKDCIPYRLSIAGDGPLKSKIEKELRSQIKQNKVRFVGFLDKTRLAEFYRDNNILLITSEWETGPIVAWEAMFSGLAIVSSKYVGSCLEGALINEETALLFPIGESKVAAKQITRLTEYTLREKIIRNGMEMARSRYSMDCSVSSWEQAFHFITNLEPRKQNSSSKNERVQNSGRLDLLLGTQAAELFREYLGRKGYCRDPGCEWPHSLSSKFTSKRLLDYAKTLDEDENA